MSNQVTLKQLAKELNLSISTVSKALKNSYEINENTIAKVQALAKKYNYRPNRMALSLKSNQTKTIGVIIPNILNYFFSKVLMGIENEASKNGYQIIIYLSNNKLSKEVEGLEMLSDGSVDGFILSIAKETQAMAENEHFKAIIKEGYPMVMFDRVAPEIACDKVIIDDEKAAYDATNYLLNHRRKKIIYISSLSALDIGKNRETGYANALKQYKNYKHKPIAIHIKNKTEYKPAITRLLEQHPDIDAVLTTDNVAAMHLLQGIHKKGLKIPKDIAIIGFSDDNLSRLAYPALSVIDQNALEIGKNAAAMLIERLKSKNSKDFKTKVVATKLVVRETS